MAIITTGTTFSGPGDDVTSSKLNNIADAATFNDPVDDSSLELINGGTNNGKLGIKDLGVTFAKLTDVINDDTMATASATKLATSQSIKNYVDNNSITINRKRVSSTTNLIVSTIIPLDDTIPQIGEGGQVLSTTFTPTSTDNKILIEFNGFANSDIAGGGVTMAVFEGSFCKGAQWWSQSSSGTSVSHITFEFTPGSTSESNYSLRIGTPTGGQNAYVNYQFNAAHTLGGFQEYSMTISEVQS